VIAALLSCPGAETLGRQLHIVCVIMVNTGLLLAG
jgi:hypothetical protein